MKRETSNGPFRSPSVWCRELIVRGLMLSIAGLMVLCLPNCKKLNPEPPENVSITEMETGLLATKFSKGFAKLMSVEVNRVQFYQKVRKEKNRFEEKLFFTILNDLSVSSEFVSSFNLANNSQENKQSLLTKLRLECPLLCVHIPDVFIAAQLPSSAAPVIRDFASKKMIVNEHLVIPTPIFGLLENQVVFYLDIKNAQSKAFVNIVSETVENEAASGEYNWLLKNPSVKTHIFANCEPYSADVYVCDIIDDLQEVAKPYFAPTAPPPPPSPCLRDNNNESNYYLSLQLQSIQALYAFGNNPCEYVDAYSGIWFGNVGPTGVPIPPGALGAAINLQLEEYYDFKIVANWAVPQGSIGGTSVNKIFVSLFQLVDPPTWTTSTVNAGPYGSYIVFTVTDPGFTQTLEYPLQLPLFAFGNWVNNTWDPSQLGDLMSLSMFESDPCTWSSTSNSSSTATNSTTYTNTLTVKFAKYADLVVGGSAQYSGSNTTSQSHTITAASTYEIGQLNYGYCWDTNVHLVQFGNLLNLGLSHTP
jgi:hypothetical protein